MLYSLNIILSNRGEHFSVKYLYAFCVYYYVHVPGINGQYQVFSSYASLSRSQM